MRRCTFVRNMKNMFLIPFTEEESDDAVAIFIFLHSSAENFTTKHLDILIGNST